MRTLFIVLSLFAFSALIEAMRLSDSTKNLRLAYAQKARNEDIVNGESIDARVKLEKGIKYNTEF